MSAIEPHTFHSKGPSLSSVLAEGTTWERALVAIGPDLRLALAIVTGLLVAVAGATRHVRPLLPVHEPPGFFLFGWPWVEPLALRACGFAHVYAGLSLALLVLAAMTRGFAIAGRRLQLTLGVLAGLGALALAIPVAVLLIAAANAVAWIVFGAVVAALCIGVLWIVFATLLDL